MGGKTRKCSRKRGTGEVFAGPLVLRRYQPLSDFSLPPACRCGPSFAEP